MKKIEGRLFERILVAVITVFMMSANALAQTDSLARPFPAISLGEFEQEDVEEDVKVFVDYELISLEPQDKQDVYTFEFIETPVDAVLRAIAGLTNSNIVMHDGIEGTITFSLKDVTLDEVLDVIAQTKGLAYTRQGNIYIFAPSDVIPGNNKPTQARYQLQYITPETARPFMEALFPSQVTFVVDDITRSVLISGPQVVVEQAVSVLDQVDVRQKQVVLMTSVLEISKDNMTRLGIDNRNVPGTDNRAPSVSLMNEIVNIFTSPVFIMGTLFEIQTELDALSTEQNAKVLATPSLAAMNGKEASIFLGDSVPIIRRGAEGAVDVDWVEIGIDMSYTPWINDNNEISLDLKVDVESISAWIEDYPSIDSRSIDTTVRAESGQPIVIGGLFTTKELETMSKIPILGDLPFLGALFKSKRTDYQETEVVIILVPYVI